jgi:hypothetical protein
MSAVIPVDEGAPNVDGGGAEETRLAREQREIRDALVAVLVRVQACRAVASGSQENTNAKYREPDGPQESMFDLIQQVRNEYRKSVWANRDKDEDGPRLTFGILEKPTNHLVALQTTEKHEDIVLKDAPTIAERCGCMKWMNNFNAFYTCFDYTIGVLFKFSVLPMSIFVMAGIWQVDLAVEHAFLICWNLYFVLNLIWMICYILCYGNIQAMTATLRSNPTFSMWLTGSSLVYTTCSILYAPSLWNVAAVLNGNIVSVVHKLFFGATVVFMKMRQTRANFEVFFVPKGWFAKVWLFFDIYKILLDVGRHLATLYAAQVLLEAEGKAFSDAESVAGFSIAGKAYHITLRQVMNASYTCSLLFTLNNFILSLRGGQQGSKFPNMNNRRIVNLK